MEKKIPEIPIWRVFLNIPRLFKDPIKVIDESFKRYGDTYITHPGGQYRSVITTNTNLIQHILQKNHSNYEKSPLQTDVLAKYLGYGLLTTNGSYWLQQRRLIQPGFHKRKLEGLNNIMQTSILRFCDDLEERLKSKSEFDMSELMTEVTLHVVAQSLFSTGITQEHIERLGNDVTILQRAIVKDVRLPMFKWWRKINGEQTYYEKKAKEAHGLIMDIITARKEQGEEHDDLLDMLLGVRYADTNEPMTDQQVLEESLVLMVAGHETSANAMTWLFYLLSQNPEILSTLESEVEENPRDHLSMQEAMELTLISNAVSESMRLFPPAWITDRVAIEDDECEGVKIKKGDVIAPYIYGVHRDEKNWNEPLKFNPTRFDKSNIKAKPNYSYFPFGGGPRLCIGQSFALLEMQLLVYHLLKRFEFEFIEYQKVEMEPLVTLRPKNPMMMRIRKRIK